MTFPPDAKDYIERAVWTAIETALAVIIGTNLMDIDLDTLQAAGISGLSAALTVMSVYVRKKRAQSEIDTGSDT